LVHNWYIKGWFLFDIRIFPRYIYYMKQKAKTFFYGILAVFTFSLILAACPTDTSSKIPSVNGTSKLSLSGQVYNYEQNTDQDTDQDTDPGAGLLTSLLIGPQEFKGDLDISDGGLGGNGKIEKGKLSYTIVAVGPQSLLPIDEGLAYLKNYYSSLNFSPRDANAAPVTLQITDDEEYSGLMKGLLNIDMDFTKMTIKITMKVVNYVYVDKDLTITAGKKTFINSDFGLEDLGFPITLTSEKINLHLKKGWNSLYEEITAQSNIPPDLLALLPSLVNSPNPDLSGLNLSKLRPTGTLKMSVSDPGNLNWTLIPSQSFDDIVPQPPEFP